MAASTSSPGEAGSGHTVFLGEAPPAFALRANAGERLQPAQRLGELCRRQRFQPEITPVPFGRGTELVFAHSLVVAVPGRLADRPEAAPFVFGDLDGRGVDQRLREHAYAGGDDHPLR